MNSSRATTMNVEKHRDRFSVPFLCLLMLLLFLSKNANSTTTINVSDTSKKQFDLNDPRNPNCPCHKYQKIADDEYKEQLKKEKKANGSISTTNAAFESNNVKRKIGTSVKSKHKKRNNRSHKKNEGYFKRYWKNFRSKKDPSSCFHW